MPKYPSANNVASVVRSYDGKQFSNADNESRTESVGLMESNFVVVMTIYRDPRRARLCHIHQAEPKDISRRESTGPPAADFFVAGT